MIYSTCLTMFQIITVIILFSAGKNFAELKSWGPCEINNCEKHDFAGENLKDRFREINNCGIRNSAGQKMNFVRLLSGSDPPRMEQSRPCEINNCGIYNLAGQNLKRRLVRI